MLTITRKNLTLMVSDNIIPSQGSSDVPVKFVNDTETYKNFLIEPRVGYYANGCPKSCVCEYSTESNTFSIPAEAFKSKGILVIAIALVDNTDSNHIEVTKEIALEVTPAPNGTVILPATDTWQTAVDNLVEQLYNQDYKPLYDKALEDINEAVQTANTASSDATDAVNTANETSELINQKVQDGSFIPNITVGETTTGAAGTEANVEITGPKQNPVLNFTIPKGIDGTGQTTVTKDDAVQQTISINTEEIHPSSPRINVEVMDIDGNVMQFDSTADKTLVYNTLGNSNIQLSTLLSAMKSLLDIALFTSDPSQIFSEIEEYLP